MPVFFFFFFESAFFNRLRYFLVFLNVLFSLNDKIGQINPWLIQEKCYLQKTSLVLYGVCCIFCAFLSQVAGGMIYSL